MRLFPFLEFDDAETPISFATRLAAFHADERLSPFLYDMGITPMDLLKGRDEALTRLSEVSGVALDRLRNAAFAQVPGRKFRFRGEEFSPELMRSPETAFCPACVAEFDEGCAPPAVQRRHLGLWNVKAFRTCPKHMIAMCVREATVWSDPFNEMMVRVEERGLQLRELANRQVRREVSSLQRYVTKRLAGEAGPDWLDRQRIDQAVRTCEMVGILFTKDSSVDLRQVSEAEWDNAGEVGFQAASGGEASLRAAFDAFLASSVVSSKQAGPQYAFGHLYKWLVYNRGNKEPGSIVEVLREYIFDNFAIPAGKVLLGQSLEKRRLHNLSTLYHETGVHRETIKKFIGTELLPIVCGSERGSPLFEADKGVEIANRIKNAVTLKALPSVLNCSRTRAQQLIEAGFFEPVDAVLDSGVQLKGYVRKSVEDLLNSVNDVVQSVETISAGMISIGEATMLIKCKAVEIIDLVLGGKLKKLERLTSQRGLAPIHICPDELSPLLTRQRDMVSYNVASDMLKLRSKAAALILSDENQRRMIPCVMVPARKKNGLLRRFSVNDIEEFKSSFATSSTLAAEAGMSLFALERKLKELRTPPTLTREESGMLIFRRCDIPWEQLGC